MTAGSNLKRQALVAVAFALVIGAITAGGSLAAPGTGGPHRCMSVEGVVIEQLGSATCISDTNPGSVAVASGVDAYAAAGNGGTAEATGAWSYATAENQSTAIASGSHSRAQAVDRSNAIADGPFASATAVLDSTAEAFGAGSSAHAGNGSTASASGGCEAEAVNGAVDTCDGRSGGPAGSLVAHRPTIGA
jgi:hypothetical protein